ncbi:hypothetical protein BOW53_09450 [Solemya pervernicosa gill symbiont]|uniref:Alkylmercury lyase n=2 Tax=Gammaproteobacteria incertae sedis TaxID=118884 RepID=A0A1T2L4M5_9GAMM|nr:organomercurial lyase [Candidatus Reidiella endopervernicosa]OOZ39990.1 hypothetical protein BOW53_09450 [Solemya pervernicosa gill symbiont]QKQ27792.1 hypothetical protein HUE57_17010 [Candidatus Reidiella endopervernicosa]
MTESGAKPVYDAAEITLARLNELLPLAANQAALTPSFRQLHIAILKGLADSNRPLAIEAMCEKSGIDDASAAIAELVKQDLVVTNSDGVVIGAYPMIREPREHMVMLGTLELRAMCAVDALAIGMMFKQPTMIRSRCRATDSIVIINQDGEQVDAMGQCPDLHVGIQWQATDGCAAKTICLDMIYLCSAKVAAEWQGDTVETRSVLTLAEAIKLSRDFFMPLLAE